MVLAVAEVLLLWSNGGAGLVKNGYEMPLEPLGRLR